MEEQYLLRRAPNPPKPEFMCVTVCRQSDKVVCVSLCAVCLCGEGGTELGVGESGAHSSVDLVGIKVKRNVSALSGPRPAAV